MIDQRALGTVIQNSYESAAELLREAARHLEDAAGAAQGSNLNLARGTAMPAEAMVKRATELMEAAAAVRELGR